MYPDAGTFVLIRPTQTFYERIMAWIFNPTHSSATTYDVDVNGSKNILESCREAGVEHIVIPGSTTAYGAHPDNPDWLTEKSPIRGNKDFPYSWHKALVEEFCDGFEKDNPQIVMTRLRACIVLGKNVDNFVRTTILMRGLNPNPPKEGVGLAS